MRFCIICSWHKNFSFPPFTFQANTAAYLKLDVSLVFVAWKMVAYKPEVLWSVWVDPVTPEVAVLMHLNALCWGYAKGIKSLCANYILCGHWFQIFRDLCTLSIVCFLEHDVLHSFLRKYCKLYLQFSMKWNFGSHMQSCFK